MDSLRVFIKILIRIENGIKLLDLVITLNLGFCNNLIFHHDVCHGLLKFKFCFLVCLRQSCPSTASKQKQKIVVCCGKNLLVRVVSLHQTLQFAYFRQSQALLRLPATYRERHVRVTLRISLLRFPP